MKRSLLLSSALVLVLTVAPWAMEQAPQLNNSSGVNSETSAHVTTTIAPDDPEAKFHAARIVHNVTVNGKKGMRVHANFTVKYGLDNPCKLIAYFYDEDGEPLESDDPKYSNADGNVSASTTFTPQYDPALYKDLQLFVPYAALNMESGDKYNLKFYLALYDQSGKRFFGKSGWYNFTLTMP
jgi:hypothetical protein